MQLLEIPERGNIQTSCLSARIKGFSNIVCEALWSGVPLIIDETVVINDYAKYAEIESGKQIIVLALDKIETAQGVISELIDRWQEPFRYNNKIKYNFDDYIDANLDMYNSIRHS